MEPVGSREFGAGPPAPSLNNFPGATALSVASAPTDPRNVVAVHDLYKIYKEKSIETVALRGSTFSVRRGDFVSLVGPSGSGKTTLLSILAGLSLPSAGRVEINGHDITSLDEEARSRLRSQAVGLVFQARNLVPFLTAEENVALVMRKRNGRAATLRARELLDELGVADRRRHRPRQLSGGEAQRVAIAIALANEPDLVLGDEVTGELDSETAKTVMGTLLRYQKEHGVALLLVTHNPSVAALADRQLEIADGLVAER